MHNYLKYKSLLKVFFLFILIGILNKVQAQTDSLLQTLLVNEKIDSQLIAPSKTYSTGGYKKGFICEGSGRDTYIAVNNGGFTIGHSVVT